MVKCVPNPALRRQIVNNMRHDTLKSKLLVSYIVGMTGSRVLLPLVSALAPDHHLHVHVNPTFCFFLVIYVVVQAIILLAQQNYGATGHSFLPKKYGLHQNRCLVVSPSAAMLPVGAQVSQRHGG